MNEDPDRWLLRQLAEAYVDRLLVAVAGEGDLDGVAGRLVAHGGGQAGRVGDLGVAHPRDDVTLLEAGRGGGLAVLDGLDQRPADPSSLSAMLTPRKAWLT